MDRKKKILMLLIAVLVSIILYKLLIPVQRQRVKTLRYTGKKFENTLSKKAFFGEHSASEFFVRLDMLNKPVFKTGKTRRDLFYLRNRLEENEKPVMEKSSSIEKTAYSHPIKHKAEIDLPQYTYFGSLLKDDIIIIFLSKGNDVYLIKEGETVDDDYLVKMIESDRMTLLSINTGEKIEINLIENAPLRIIAIKR